MGIEKMLRSADLTKLLSFKDEFCRVRLNLDYTQDSNVLAHSSSDRVALLRCFEDFENTHG